jgi:hypothetical protein
MVLGDHQRYPATVFGIPISSAEFKVDWIARLFNILYGKRVSEPRGIN